MKEVVFMIKSYKLGKLYKKTNRFIIKRIVSQFSDEFSFIKSSDDKTVIFEFSVEKLKENKNLINIFDQKFYFSILTTSKLIKLIKNFDNLKLDFISASFKYKNNLEMCDDEEDRLNEFIAKRKIESLSDKLNEDSIEVDRIQFRIDNKLRIKINRDGIFYVDEEDFKKYRNYLLKLGNFLYTGEVNEKF